MNKTNPVAEQKNINIDSLLWKNFRKCKKKRIITKQNINIIFRVDSKLSKIIKLGKDALEKSEMSNVVSKLECISCDKTYVGQQEDFLTSEEMNMRITLI